MKKDENVEGYAQSKRRGDKLWKKSKTTKSKTRSKNLKDKAKLQYARMEAYEKKLDHPEPSHKETHITFDFSKSKTTEIKNNNASILSGNSKNTSPPPKKTTNKKNSKKTRKKK